MAGRGRQNVDVVGTGPFIVHVYVDKLGASLFNAPFSMREHPNIIQDGADNMKKLIIAVTLAALVTVGCASDPNKMPEPAGNSSPVHLGMTKEEVLKSLGHKPKSISMTPRGEIWHYDNVELAYIPFNFGFHPEFKTFTFDNNGVLIDFNTTQPTK